MTREEREIIEAIKIMGYDRTDYPREKVSAVISMAIKALQTEVVRCKDCRHRDLFSCPLADNDFQKDDDFCSWGERKGGDDE